LAQHFPLNPAVTTRKLEAFAMHQRRRLWTELDKINKRKPPKLNVWKGYTVRANRRSHERHFSTLKNATEARPCRLVTMTLSSGTYEGLLDHHPIEKHP